MPVIFCILLAAIISALLAFAEPMLDGMFSVVFDVAGQIPGVDWQLIARGISDVIYQAAVYLMIIKFLVKMFNPYVLWTHGEDADPIQMVINFAKAAVVAFSFPYIYRYFIGIAQGMINTIFKNISYATGTDLNNFFEGAVSSLGIGPLLVGVVFLVEIIIMYFSFMKRGIELEMMILGVPLACTGLLDNDKGIFKSYMNQMVKILITVMFQLVIMKVGLAIGLSAGIFDGTAMNMLWGIAGMFLSLKVPQIMSEWMIASGGGGGGMSKIYTISMVGRAVKGLIR